MSMLVAGITGFLNERVKMGDEERQAQADLKTAEAERKKDAMKLVATLVADKDFIESGGMGTKYFQQNLTAAGYKTEDFTGIANQMADVDASFNFGSVLPAGEDISLVAASYDKSVVDFLAGSLNQLEAGDLDFEVIYRSIYGERWKIDNKSSLPEKLEDAKE